MESRPLRPWFRLVTSALVFAFAFHSALRGPKYAGLFAALLVVSLLPRWLARRRMKQVLMSGEVERILDAWKEALTRVVHPETMRPLMTATAYAAYGWIEEAHRALDRAVKGPAWEAAIEQRLFVETLLDAFEGDRARALEKASLLEQMPLPKVGLFARHRVARLRRGVLAFARAFAHRAEPRDVQALRQAASSSPLIHWAMRYASAVAAVDRGEAGHVGRLLEGAPNWPEESAFRVFHDELVRKTA